MGFTVGLLFLFGVLVLFLIMIVLLSYYGQFPKAQTGRSIELPWSLYIRLQYF
jgi:hypothetical protein